MSTLDAHVLKEDRPSPWAKYPQRSLATDQRVEVSSLGGDGDRMELEHGGDDGDEAKYGGDDGDEEMEHGGGGLTVAVVGDGGHGW